MSVPGEPIYTALTCHVCRKQIVVKCGPWYFRTKFRERMMPLEADCCGPVRMVLEEDEVWRYRVNEDGNTYQWPVVDSGGGADEVRER